MAGRLDWGARGGGILPRTELGGRPCVSVCLTFAGADGSVACVDVGDECLLGA